MDQYRKAQGVWAVNGAVAIATAKFDFAITELDDVIPEIEEEDLHHRLVAMRDGLSAIRQIANQIRVASSTLARAMSPGMGTEPVK